MSKCPSEEQLANHAAGGCSEERAAAIEAHLRECPRCRECVERLREDEAWVEGVRRAAGPEGLKARPEAKGGMSAGHTQTRKLPDGQSPAGPTVQIEGYEITRELSRGGQGVVYQAIQRSTKRKVAIKVLLEGPYASKSARKRFEREIELVAQLKHPSIISIFHSGTTQDGRQFYVMDYVRGMPLQHYVREKKLTLEETLNLFATVCEAVQHAHQKGMIHRDLKPSNILVDAAGSAKVMDFGLAKWLYAPVETVVSMTEQIIGTLPYMSPEQARGNPDEIDTRTDVYALGVILYELLTGHYPYPVVGQLVEVLKHITETPPTPPSRSWNSDSGVTKRSSRRLRPGQCPIDDEVQTIVLRALAKERGRRYQSAGELARDVGHYLADEPIEAKRDSGWYVLKKAVRKYRAVAIATAVVMTLSAGLAVSSVIAWDWYLEAEDARAAERAQRELAEAQTAHVRRTSQRLQESLYFSRVALAQSAYQAGDIPRAVSILQNCPETLRNWEWRYLQALADQSIMTLRHGPPVKYVAFIANGTQIASAGGGRLTLWDTATGRELRSESIPDRARISLNARHIAWSSGAKNDRVIVRDIATGQEAVVVQGEFGRSYPVAFSPDGLRLLVSHEDSLRVWDISEARELLALQKGTLSNAVFSPNASQILTVHRRSPSQPGPQLVCRVWDAETGEEVVRLGSQGIQNVHDIAASPDGRRVAAAVQGSAGNIGLQVWDIVGNAELAAIETGGGGEYAVAWHPDGTQFVSGGYDRVVKLWDLATGDSITSFHGHTHIVKAVAFSPDGNRVLSGSDDGTVKVWDRNRRSAPTRFRLRTLLTFDELWNSGDNRHSAKDPWHKLRLSIEVEDPTTGRKVLHIGSSPIRPPDDRWCNLSECGLTVLHLRAASTIPTPADVLSVMPRIGFGRLTLALAPEAQRVAGIVGFTLGVWDLASGERILRIPDGEYISVAISTDGAWLAVVDTDGMLTIYPASGEGDTQPIRCALPFDTRHPFGPTLTFSPDGARIAVAGDVRNDDGWVNTVMLFDCNRDNGLFSVEFDAKTSLPGMDVVFSRDGRYMAARQFQEAPIRTYIIKVWDTETRSEVTSIDVGAWSGVLALSPDGTRVLGSHQDAVRVWDTATGEEIVALEGDACDRLTFSKDGRSVVGSSYPVKGRGTLSWLIEDMETRRLAEEALATLASATDTADAYKAAYETATRAAQCGRWWREREHPVGLRAVGIACYRLAEYERALELLRRSNAENASTKTLGWKDHPADMAFMAMTLYRLGQEEEAQAALDRAYAVMQDPQYAKDELLKGFLCEAEHLILDATYARQKRETFGEAYALVMSLFEEEVLAEDVIVRLRGDGDCPEPVRAAAIFMAGCGAAGAGGLNAGSWRLARSPGRDPSEYRRAVKMAAKACQLEPGNGLYLNTLGVAQYRTGAYDKALETLMRSDRMNSERYKGGLPSDAAFIAMALHQLGRIHEAGAGLERLRELMKKERWAKSEEAQGFLREAEALISGVAQPISQPNGEL